MVLLPHIFPPTITPSPSSPFPIVHDTPSFTLTPATYIAVLMRRTLLPLRTLFSDTATLHALTHKCTHKVQIKGRGRRGVRRRLLSPAVVVALSRTSRTRRQDSLKGDAPFGHVPFTFAAEFTRWRVAASGPAADTLAPRSEDGPGWSVSSEMHIELSH